MILPSLLEYSNTSLEQKLLSVLDNLPKFQNLTSQKIAPFQTQDNQKMLHFHLDFVLEQFAKDRSVMKSLDLETVFAILKQKMSGQNLALTVHLMGESEDWPTAFQFWQQLIVPNKWQVDLFVPAKLTKLFTFAKMSCRTWTWFDLNQWENLGDNFEKSVADIKIELENDIQNLDLNQDLTKSSLNNDLETSLENQSQVNKPFKNEEIKVGKKTDLLDNLKSPEQSILSKSNVNLGTQKNKVLLMTVKAGLSGQKMTPETKQKALQTIKNNPSFNFIVDGGWQIEDLAILANLHLSNVDLVSYSSFWQNLN